MKKRNHLRTYIQKVMQDSNSTKSKKYVDSFKYCEYTPEISEKFYRFLDLSLKMPFEIQTEKESFTLTINLSDYDGSNQNINSNSINLYNDNFVSFHITKNNFKITKNHMETCGYSDPNIYELYKSKFEENYKRKSAATFHKTIDEILDIIPAIGREYKIDEILKD
jgi:outer membrane receptor for ferrienterochelin and colicin